MAITLRQRVVLCSVAAKRRKFWLMAATALAPISLGVSEPALAQCSTSGSITTCDQFGNTYSSGINFGGAGLPVDLRLLPGVNVVIPSGAGQVNAVNAANTTGSSDIAANISITANGVTITARM